MPQQIQLRRGTAAAWASANTQLAAGEIGVETDTGKFKCGNGSTLWNSLGYANASAPGYVPILANSTNSAAATADIVNIGYMHRFTGTGAKTLDFDTADGWAAGYIYHVSNRAASGDLTLTGTGVTLTAPKGGSLVLEPGDTVSVHFTSSSAADVFGSTA
jgi:hypothetical protein